MAMVRPPRVHSLTDPKRREVEVANEFDCFYMYRDNRECSQQGFADLLKRRIRRANCRDEIGIIRRFE